MPGNKIRHIQRIYNKKMAENCSGLNDGNEDKIFHILRNIWDPNDEIKKFNAGKQNGWSIRYLQYENGRKL